MKPWQALALLAFVVVPFLVYGLLRPQMYGVDEYSFVSYICNGTRVPANVEPIGLALMNVLPCNFNAFKAILFLLCLACVFVIAFTGELFDEKRGWLAGFLVFGSSLWLLQFFKFEFQLTFAFLPILIGQYFLIKHKTSNQGKGWTYLFGFFWLGIAFLIWRGTILVALAWSSVYLLLAFPAMLAFGYYWKPILSNILPNFGVSENAPLIGGFYLMALLGGYLWLPGLLVFPLALFTFFGLLSSKFIVLAIPLLAVSLATNFDRFKFVFKGYRYDFRYLFVFVPIALLIGTIAGLPNLPPTNSDIEAVHYALLKSGYKQVCNDWDTGSWIQFYSKSDLDYNRISGYPNCDYNAAHGIVLTQYEMDGNAYKVCPLLKGFGRLKVFDCSGGS